MSRETIESYVREVYELFSSGEAREESYFSLLENFLLKMGSELKVKGVNIITMPKKTDAGNPDFVIKGPAARIVGYIEAKEPLKNLADIENSPQVKRYREVFPNLVLTNFLEFRLYREGELTQSVNVVEEGFSLDMGKPPKVSNPEKLGELLAFYFSFSYRGNLDTRELARELARRTRFMRDYVVMEELNRAGSVKKGEEENHIRGFYNAFKTYLIHDLQEKDFVDLYSQTLTFGLFTAAIQCRELGKKFKREKALRYIPYANGILHNLFEFISIGNVPRQLQAIMDEIVHVMNAVDIHTIFYDYFLERKGEDPIHHFYETFLSEYDPRVRERRGVYYTPHSVVGFIVRSIHSLLREKLNRIDGLADRELRILDPAAGTSTFLVEAASLAIVWYAGKYGEGTRAEFARKYLTDNLYGFEIMMAPYAVAHLNMAYMLEIAGGKLEENQPLNLYLTNTLEMDDIEQSDLPGMSTLSRESRRAGEIKKNTPLHVIMGNPPYSGHSLTNSHSWVTTVTKSKQIKRRKVKTWIGEQIEAYKYLEGKPLDEKNLKWLQDDYVKFIRFAQVKIQETGEGVVGLVTNHGYLDNPTFRGMRWSLLNTFNEIYILNLHGNAMKKEHTPEGSVDENVFDIRQGVAITFFVKIKNGGSGCNVFYADLWGQREAKYVKLGENEIRTILHKRIFPKPPFYLFVPGAPAQERTGERFLYENFCKVTDIFPLNSVGIVTARDSLTIKGSVEEMRATLEQFAGMDAAYARLTFKLGDDSRDWLVEEAQKDVLETHIDAGKIVPILYRPFDTRFTYYTGKSRGFLCMPRPEVMRNMLGENIGLITVRQVAEGEFNHCFVAESMVEGRVTTSNKGIAYFFPLYVYQKPVKTQKGLFNHIDTTSADESTPREPNLHPRVFEMMGGMIDGPLPTPEQIFYYIYAVMFSPVYRERYKEHLKIDFPRVPFVSDYDLFQEMARLGEQLAAVHLLKSPELEQTFSKFEVKGDNRVKKVHYVPPVPPGEGEGRVYINSTQYFSNISPEIWGYQLCGYQVMDRWLKSRYIRKSHEVPTLSLEDMAHYLKIARAVQLTIQYQQAIDRLFPFIEKHFLEMKTGQIDESSMETNL